MPQYSNYYCHHIQDQSVPEKFDWAQETMALEYTVKERESDVVPGPDHWARQFNFNSKILEVAHCHLGTTQVYCERE